MRALLAEQIVYPLYEALSGRRILTKLDELKSYQWRSAAELKARQLTKLQQLVEYACESVPYYTSVYADRGFSPASIQSVEDLGRFPILTKELIQEHKNELVSKAYSERQLLPNHTGGSTGKPLRFFQDRRQRDYGSASRMLCNGWAGWSFGGRTLRLWGHPADAAASQRLWGRLRSVALNDFTFDTFHFSEDDMMVLARHMQSKPVDIIIAYASSLHHFARYLDRNDLTVPSPKGIISSADMLTQAQRSLIEEVFDTKVFNRYGCREVDLIAAECPEHTGLHIDINRLVVEFVDKSGEPCHPGDRSHLVVTDLTNYAMPFIRYRIEDLSTQLDTVCPCGRELPLMREPLGRKSALLRTPDGDFVSANALTTILSDIRGLGQVQFVQRQLDHLIVRVVRRGAYDNTSESGFRSALRDLFGSGMHIEFDYVDVIAPSASGKYQLSISHIESAAGADGEAQPLQASRDCRE